MELYLQFGWGMMDHSRYLIRKWGSGTVILSPRDLSPTQLMTLSKDLRRLGGTVLLDPQLYLPHEDHHRLSSHPYWPQHYDSGMFWGGQPAIQLLRDLASLNQRLGCRDLILPGLYNPSVDDDALGRLTWLIEQAKSLYADRFGLIASLALSEQATRDSNQVHELLEVATTWDVSGVYLISEHPRGSYLVQDPTWMANVIDLVAGLRLQGKRVILGYSNHQELIAACASATAIASGTWMNVRQFPPEKFRAQTEDDFRTRRPWLYCPQALSEYAVPYLDVARDAGILERMASPSGFEGELVKSLFLARRPSDVGLGEQAAFRYYLISLAHQARLSRKGTFDKTVESYERTLNEAQGLLVELRSAGVLGQHRDFSNSVDANISALRKLCANRGPVLRRYWDNLAS